MDLYRQITANKRRSWLLIAAFVALVVVVGLAADLVVGLGPIAVVIAVVIAVAGVAGAYWRSDAIALAVSHAQPADPVAHARLHNLVEGLCIAGGLPKPGIYVIDDPAPNAFATGRDPKHASLAVTTGLLERLNRVELEGVLAHELSHVKNYDILVSTLAVTLVGVVTILADVSLRFLWWGGPRHRDDRARHSAGGPAMVMAVLGLVLLVLAPLVARVMQAAVSRRREALADVSAVALTRYPPGLLSALEKLRDDTTVVHSASRATAHLWIESPVARLESEGRQAWLNRLFDTHPPLEERIQALREL
ncbi:MAG: M48 family metallopeptidase [Acidimicrobiales bacterium]